VILNVEEADPKRFNMNKEILNVAIDLAFEVHRKQTDKSGFPYILHSLHVMNTINSDDIELKCIAVLHDVIEDSNMTIKDLRINFSEFSERILHVLDILTRRKRQSYDEYIQRIKTNKDAIIVKIADLKHNMDITRLKEISDKDIERLKKYHKYYNELIQLV